MNDQRDVDNQMRSLQSQIETLQTELNALKRSRHARDVDDYTFAVPNGSRRLSELFGDHDDLIVIHNMGSTCPYCTMWGDGLNGLGPYIADRAGFVIVSPDAPDRQQEFAASRGWNVRMVSDAERAFTREMGFVTTQDGGEYFLPGFSVFHRDESGRIRRVAADYFGPGDVYCGAWHMFDLLDGGAGRWHPKFQAPLGTKSSDS